MWLAISGVKSEGLDGRRCFPDSPSASGGIYPAMMSTFIGVDLGWYGKPSGLASIGMNGAGLCLRNVTRLEETDQILSWIQSEAGSGSSVVGVDAPLVIRNRTGIRLSERELNRDFRRFDAGCHAANLGRPFARNVISFSRRLSKLG